MSEWVTKMLALTQIKATTSSKDLRQLHAALDMAPLHAALDKAPLLPRLQGVDAAIGEQIHALASPRQSRSP